MQRLPDAPTLPDSVFVEDAAIVCDEIAVEGTVICADHTPRTIEALRAQGFL